jgi:hypothetical protein
VGPWQLGGLGEILGSVLGAPRGAQQGATGSSNTPSRHWSAGTWWPCTRVGQIDQQRGLFELQSQQGSFTSVIPANAGRATIDHFRRVRPRTNVALEGTLTTATRIDLYPFL